MAKNTAPNLDPDKFYKIKVKRTVEHDGVTYRLCAGINHTVNGSVLAAILEDVESYEEK